MILGGPLVLGPSNRRKIIVFFKKRTYNRIICTIQDLIRTTLTGGNHETQVPVFNPGSSRMVCS